MADEEKTKEPERPWELARITPEEAVEVLERKASQEVSMQARLVENGDRNKPFVDVMRDAHVMFHVATMLRQKIHNEKNGRRGSATR